MSRFWSLWWPQSLFARLLWVWLMGLALVLGAATWLALGERVERGQAVLNVKLAQELGASADWLDTLTAEQRVQWVEDAHPRRPRWRMEAPRVWADARSDLPPHTRTLMLYLQEELPERQVQVQVGSVDRSNSDGKDPHAYRLRLEIWASLKLADGARVYARLPDHHPGFMGMGLPRVGSNTPWLLVALTVITGLALLTWLAVVYATRPLKRMTQAAKDLANNPHQAPLLEDGPLEVRQAAQAFNHMQAQLQRQMAQQTQVLAAITHDLQTPLTRLRLKTEWIGDESLRQRMQADLSEMQGLVQDGLALARSWHAQPHMQRVDLGQMLQALQSEWEDLGWAVQLEGAEDGALVDTDVSALRRVLGNVVHNAITYGQRATVGLWLDKPARWRIVVEDEGPGLPEADLKAVLEPFVRQEASRNRQTGGTGLGLTIASNLMAALGGDLRLANRPQGGLRVTIIGGR
jgi:protein-histidine pros-kinase